MITPIFGTLTHKATGKRYVAMVDGDVGDEHRLPLQIFADWDEVATFVLQLQREARKAFGAYPTRPQSLTMSSFVDMREPAPASASTPASANKDKEQSDGRP